MTAIANGNRNARTALLLALLVVSMVGLAFASVPLYRLFCQVTGFGGIPVRAETAPGAAAGEVGVRFDSNVSGGLPWKFEPVSRTVKVVPGERVQINYQATNLVARPTSGTATFNVTPTLASKYFNKIECFCFTEQVLKGGEKVLMPVTFFVDPKMLEDPDTAGIGEITLSYTFYPVETQTAAR